LIHEASDGRAHVDAGADTAICGEAKVLDLHGGSRRIATGREIGIPAVELAGQFVRRRIGPLHAIPGGKTDGSLGVQIEQVASGDGEDSMLERDRQDAVAARPALSEQGNGTRVDVGEVGDEGVQSADGRHGNESNCAAAEERYRWGAYRCEELPYNTPQKSRDTSTFNFHCPFRSPRATCTRSIS
jgi:hypothetical protein